MGATSVHRYTQDRMQWKLSGGTPFYSCRAGQYTHNWEVDPYPAYPHDFDLVQAELSRASSAFPVSGDVDFYVLSREKVDRVNAYCECSNIYDYSKKSDERVLGWQASVMLSAKRTPIHPAVTRYLVAHEYGHVVAWHLARRRGLETSMHGNFYQEYANLRGCAYYEGDKGGEWHVETSEIFANDFRVLVLGAEEEFWPHPTVAFPRTVPGLFEFWRITQATAWKETKDGEEQPAAGAGAREEGEGPALDHNLPPH